MEAVMNKPSVYASSYAAGLTDSDICVYPGCNGTRRSRGLCHQCYQAWRDAERNGEAASEADLMKHGLLLPKGTGGRKSVVSHDGFRKNSVVRGRASRSP